MMSNTIWYNLHKIEWNMRDGAVKNAIIAILAADRLQGMTPNRLSELYNGLNDKDKKRFIKYIELITK